MIGISTLGFPNRSNKQLAQTLAGQGIKMVQLFFNQTDSRYWKYNGRSDLSDMTAARSKSIASAYRSAGISIHSLGVYTNLIHPDEVFTEVARILKPGGKFVVTFSNRWFPPKVINVWPALHEFERMGLVLEYFIRTGKFNHLNTFSSRGWPRPITDKYYPQFRKSDPVYAVWGETIA